MAANYHDGGTMQNTRIQARLHALLVLQHFLLVIEIPIGACEHTASPLSSAERMRSVRRKRGRTEVVCEVSLRDILWLLRHVA